MSVRDLLIVGAGPSGLAAAIAAKQHGLDYQVVEQGVLVNSIFRFPPQMVFFTTPELLEIGGLPFVSPYDKPTRAEALTYYRKVVDRFDLSIAFEERVLHVARDAAEQVFEVETQSSKGVRRVRLARHVIFAVGYYDHPVRLGIEGEDLPHVSHYFADPHLHYRQRVVVVGGGNSAAEAALLLYRAGVHVTIVHRHPGLKRTIKYWVRPDIENRIKEGSVAARFNACVREITRTTVVIDHQGTREEIPAEGVFLLTGYHPDVDLMRTAGIHVDDVTLAPELNMETFETNVPNMFIAGGAIAGKKTGNIFIENGRFHGERVIQSILAGLQA